MNPWKLLDATRVPGEGDEMKLWQRAEEFSIKVGHDELMNSRIHGSEDALAELSCGRMADRKNPRVLIGGLGLGFTLRAALDQLGRDAEVIVAELVPAVVKWNRTHLAHLAGNPLNDRRVNVRESDVGLVIKEQQGAFDVIMLDVDNGPDGLTHEGNDRLYTMGGLEAAKAALREGGILAVWSAGPDKKFLKRLRSAGFKKVEEVAVRGHARGGRPDIVWLAEKAQS
ncbi:spermidine synthase [Verrucomicrobiota bacterium]